MDDATRFQVRVDEARRRTTGVLPNIRTVIRALGISPSCFYNYYRGERDVPQWVWDLLDELSFEYLGIDEEKLDRSGPTPRQWRLPDGRVVS